MLEPMNPYQRAALKVYANGDFNHLVDEVVFKDLGDSLLTFVLIELSTNEGCEDLETAKQRIRTGIEDLQGVLDALDRMSTD